MKVKPKKDPESLLKQGFAIIIPPNDATLIQGYKRIIKISPTFVTHINELSVLFRFWSISPIRAKRRS